MDITRGKGGKKAFLLDLVFPMRCPFCDEFIEYDRLCCEECADEILWADENICTVCGKSLTKGCICPDVSYDRCIPAAYFTDRARYGIHSLKFRSGKSAADVLGRVIGDRLRVMGLMNEIDLAVPVPMTAIQLRQRGYNQAELIARAIVEGTDIPIECDLLERHNVKTSQHLLGAEERYEAVKMQYSAAQDKDLSGMTVLLADDVLTTGATLNYCAYLLKEKLRAKRVICGVGATTL